MRETERLCDELDACVFTGDMLFSDDDRNKLKDYIERWNRAIKEHEEYIKLEGVEND